MTANKEIMIAPQTINTSMIKYERNWQSRNRGNSTSRQKKRNTISVINHTKPLDMTVTEQQDTQTSITDHHAPNPSRNHTEHVTHGGRQGNAHFDIRKKNHVLTSIHRCQKDGHHTNHTHDVHPRTNLHVARIATKGLAQKDLDAVKTHTDHLVHTNPMKRPNDTHREMIRTAVTRKKEHPDHQADQK